MACDAVTTVNNSILQSLQGPSYIQTDAGTVSQHSLSELIKVAGYVSGTCASTSARQGVRFSRLIPDGCVQGFSGRRFR
jgi:hypothetical protein